ncbi:MAG: hypothetical protein KBD64_05625 [Gammaproteobacteria bacterium]|nr:hypothetical protein [Gammaproteobacteria bacterium]
MSSRSSYYGGHRTSSTINWRYNGQYFEYRTLEELSKQGGGAILHPLTRELYPADEIVDASAECKELFDKTVAEIRAEQAARPGPPLTSYLIIQLLRGYRPSSAVNWRWR